MQHFVTAPLFRRNQSHPYLCQSIPEQHPLAAIEGESEMGDHSPSEGATKLGARAHAAVSAAWRCPYAERREGGGGWAGEGAGNIRETASRTKDEVRSSPSGCNQGNAWQASFQEVHAGG